MDPIAHLSDLLPDILFGTATDEEQTSTKDTSSSNILSTAPPPTVTITDTPTTRTSTSTAPASTSSSSTESTPISTTQATQSSPPTSISTSSVRGATTSITPSPQATQVSTPPDHSNNVGAIAGGIVGSLAVLALLVLGLVWLLRRRNTNHVKLPSSNELPMADRFRPGDPRSLVASNPPEGAYHPNSFHQSSPRGSQRHGEDHKLPVQIVHELPGSPVGQELESGQNYHPYRPR